MGSGVSVFLDESGVVFSAGVCECNEERGGKEGVWEVGAGYGSWAVYGYVILECG